MVEWLASKLEVLTLQGTDVMKSKIKVTSVLISIRRLYALVDALIRLMGGGKRVCVRSEETNTVLPVEDIDILLGDLGIVPAWVQIKKDREEPGLLGQPIIGQQRLTPRKVELTIIDNSLGTTSRSVGCLGKVSASDQEKVEQWIRELDSLTLV